MITMQVAEVLDREGEEVLLELTSGDITLYAYCYPFDGCIHVERVRLYAMHAYNLRKSNCWHLPQRTQHTYFSQNICAEVVSVKERIVRVGEIEIFLDTGIDSCLSAGSLLSFDVQRLDY